MLHEHKTFLFLPVNIIRIIIVIILLSLAVNESTNLKGVLLKLIVASFFFLAIMSTVTVELLCLKQDWDLRGKAFSHKKLQKVAKTSFLFLKCLD